MPRFFYFIFLPLLLCSFSFAQVEDAPEKDKKSKTEKPAAKEKEAKVESQKSKEGSQESKVESLKSKEGSQESKVESLKSNEESQESKVESLKSNEEKKAKEVKQPDIKPEKPAVVPETVAQPTEEPAKSAGTQVAKLRIGAGLIGTAYSGDLNQEGKVLTRFQSGFNLSMQFANAKTVSPQLNAGGGKFIAQNRDLAPVSGFDVHNFVETRYFYLDFRLKVKFLKTKPVNPYASVGIGLLNYSPKDIDGNPLADNFESRQNAESYASMTAGFPIALGADIHLSHIVALGLEYVFRPTKSDYLDNIGLLGTNDGNDKLHTFALTFYLTFDPEYPILKRDLQDKEGRTRF